MKQQKQKTAIPKYKILSLAVAVSLSVTPLTSYAIEEGEPFGVNTYTTGAQRNPNVAMNANGDFVVVWESAGQDGSGLGVFGQRYDKNGITQGGEFQVNTFTTGDQRTPSVTMDANGNFVVVWNSRTNPSTNRIYMRRYNNLGVALTNEIQVDSETVNFDSVNPDVAMDADGDFVVVWEGYAWDENGLQQPVVSIQSYGANGSSNNSAQIQSSLALSSLSKPAVAMDSDGDFVVVWTDENYSSYIWEIYGQRYNILANKVGDQILVTPPTSLEATSPQVALDSDGDFVVAWDSGTFYGIYARKFSSNGVPQSEEILVNDCNTDSEPSGNTSIDIDSDGDFVVAWYGYCNQTVSSGGSPTLNLQRYDLNAQSIEGPITIDDSGGFNPSIGMDDNGNSTIVYSLGNTNPDIYARQYSRVFPVAADLSVDISSNRELFRPGKYDNFYINVINIGSQNIIDAHVQVDFDEGFEPFKFDPVFCNYDEKINFKCELINYFENSFAYKISIPQGESLSIYLAGNYSKSKSSASISATVSQGSPSDLNPTNNSATKLITAEPSQLSAAQEGELRPLSGSINPSLDTVVLTHGLQPKSKCDPTQFWNELDNRPAQAGHLLLEKFGYGAVNIVQYFWPGACQQTGPFDSPVASGYIKARRNVYHAGEQLGQKLLDKLGDQYTGKIHFVGHSLGTAVNAYASRLFLTNAENVTDAQFTILDYPNRVSRIPFMSNKDESLYGFDRDFFATVLPFDRNGLTLKVDNYYAKTQGVFDTKAASAGVGKKIRAPIPVINKSPRRPSRSE